MSSVLSIFISYCLKCISFLLGHLLGTWSWWYQLSATTILKRCFFQNDKKWCHSRNRVITKLQSHCRDLYGEAFHQSCQCKLTKLLSVRMSKIIIDFDMYEKIKSLFHGNSAFQKGKSGQSQWEESMVIHGIRSVQCEIRSIIALHGEVWYRSNWSNHHQTISGSESVQPY